MIHTRHFSVCKKDAAGQRGFLPGAGNCPHIWVQARLNFMRDHIQNQLVGSELLLVTCTLKPCVGQSWEKSLCLRLTRLCCIFWSQVQDGISAKLEAICVATTCIACNRLLPEKASSSLGFSVHIILITILPCPFLQKLLGEAPPNSHR